MKIVRILTALTIAMLVISAWNPAPVSARGLGDQTTIASNVPPQSVDPVTTKIVRLTVNNRSGGILFVTLNGPKDYYFVIADAKARFDILPGRYTVTAISTACSRTHVQSKNMKNGGNLVYYCDSQ
jgi:hypothetical protein